MDRRRFIAGLGGGLIASPMAFAQYQAEPGGIGLDDEDDGIPGRPEPNLRTIASGDLSQWTEQFGTTLVEREIINGRRVVFLYNGSLMTSPALQLEGRPHKLSIECLNRPEAAGARVSLQAAVTTDPHFLGSFDEGGWTRLEPAGEGAFGRISINLYVPQDGTYYVQLAYDLYTDEVERVGVAHAELWVPAR